MAVARSVTNQIMFLVKWGNKGRIGMQWGEVTRTDNRGEMAFSINTILQGP